ncbi:MULTISPECIES: hypothetical protein [unclassified Burkholderia]|uniref:hypothetical protein n=1 Tax=unclassified Burkholderia TaxID=2613784 RepID=UPI001FC7C4A3|nr:MULTISPECIES: hypothetical protein [unclassified Burkholderia]
MRDLPPIADPAADADVYRVPRPLVVFGGSVQAEVNIGAIQHETRRNIVLVCPVNIRAAIHGEPEPYARPRLA